MSDVIVDGVSDVIIEVLLPSLVISDVIVYWWHHSVLVSDVIGAEVSDVTAIRKPHQY